MISNRWKAPQIHQVDERDVALVVQVCRRGPFMARVAHIDVVDIPLDDALGAFHLSY
ncbi:MAG: hypothetical protein KAI66_25780 [Lentisphaeria bacterium]|nr:hypothetical protein [Lentisphaeria bacterium]